MSANGERHDDEDDEECVIRRKGKRQWILFVAVVTLSELLNC